MPYTAIIFITNKFNALFLIIYGIWITAFSFVLQAVDKQHPSESGTYPKETVEAKWEQLQYYEGSQWQNQQNSPTNTDGAFSSIASSGASSTASSSSSSKAEGIH